MRQGVTPYPLLDEAIVSYIADQRQQRITVTQKKICRKAKVLFQELYPGFNTDFKASRGWFRRMCRRNNLVHRRVTSVGQKVPGNAVEIAEDFLDEMRLL